MRFASSVSGGPESLDDALCHDIVIPCMRRHTILLVGILVFVALLVGWHMGREQGQMKASLGTHNIKLSDHEARLLPLERDLEKREKRRAKVNGLVQWVRQKIGL